MGRRDDRATALLEFAFIAPIFALFLFGIITFGYLLAFSQNVTQAANEGARAGAVALPVQGQNTADVAVAQARTAVNAALDGFDQECSDTGPMTCTFAVVPCNASAGSPDCITVTVTYDYSAEPLLPNVPLLSAGYPDVITKSATAQINPTIVGAPAPTTSAPSTTTSTVLPTTSSIDLSTTTTTIDLSTTTSIDLPTTSTP